MADASVPAPPTEAIANLILDEVTGEKVSKTELKKRNKQRENDKKKAAKAAAAPPRAVPVKKTNVEAEEKELNPNVWNKRSRSFLQMYNELTKCLAIL